MPRHWNASTEKAFTSFESASKSITNISGMQSTRSDIDEELLEALGELKNNNVDLIMPRRSGWLAQTGSSPLGAECLRDMLQRIPASTGDRRVGPLYTSDCRALK